MTEILKFLTIVQWRKINQAFLRDQPPLTLDGKSLAVFVLFTGVLIILQYFGKYPAFRWLFGDFFQTWAHPNLYPQLYWALVSVTGYFLLPAIVITGVWKERLAAYGFRIDRNPKIFLLYGGMFLAVIPLVFLVSHSPSFLRTYPFYAQAANSWTELLLWESAYALQFLALEFFFRGFVLFGFARQIGAHAIFLMATPYTMIHFQKPLPETVGAIIAGVALGTLALRTRSIAGGVVVHIAVAWSMDGFALWQKGFLQKLLSCP